MHGRGRQHARGAHLGTAEAAALAMAGTGTASAAGSAIAVAIAVEALIFSCRNLLAIGPGPADCRPLRCALSVLAISRSSKADDP